MILEYWTWITVGTRICPGCSVRHGVSQSLSDWESVGVPGDGATVCGLRCKCLLMKNELLTRISGAASSDTVADMLLLLGLQNPIQAMSATLQTELVDSGLGLLAETGYEEARLAIIEEIRAIEYIDNLELMSLEGLIDIYNGVL